MDNEARTIWCGNLADKVTEELLYELFLQAAPLEEVRIPTDKSGRKANYGFVVVKHEVSVDYVVQLLDGTCLYERPITVKPRKSNQNARTTPKTANNFIIMTPLPQLPLNFGSPPYQPNFHNERPYSKPYHRHDNYSGRHNWNNNHRNSHSNERNRRRYH
ncbi:hypothetical protein Zmor_028127 [Zophobas morio]|uniref:RRM domain-containing protein n=1 Tax=Zophobas morio TaxID=2755281 RepID=A0AA38M354_9CUCU|nr:hypothetical protein Zmor_028127 [Zophobas morio]